MDIDMDMYGVASVVFLIVAVAIWFIVTKPKGKNKRKGERKNE